MMTMMKLRLANSCILVVWCKWWRWCSQLMQQQRRVKKHAGIVYAIMLSLREHQRGKTKSQVVAGNTCSNLGPHERVTCAANSHCFVENPKERVSG
jgi:hypothetical protein